MPTTLTKSSRFMVGLSTNEQKPLAAAATSFPLWGEYPSLAKKGKPDKDSL